MTQPANDLLRAALGTKRILAVDGPNFSGRSSLLRRFCRSRADGRIYLGPEIYFALSGLTTSVRQEIELHAGGNMEWAQCLALAQLLDLTKLLDHHPASLSGGEQTGLCVLCTMILKPTAIAVDCALEQLDSQKLKISLDLLQGEFGPREGVVITDNRLDEWTHPLAAVSIGELHPEPSRYPPVPPLDPLHIDRLPTVAAPTIELRNVSAGYSRKANVLSDVCMTLTPGRVYTLRGANGSGKSTLAKILCGALRPAAGDIVVEGKRADLTKRPGQIAGYHLQNPDVGLFEATVGAELGLSSSASGSAGASAVRAIGDAMGLGTFLDKNPLALPFPVRKRISMGATIARLPPWMIVDEPTLGADAAALTALAGIISAVAAKGHGVIVISHSIRMLELLGGNELKIEDGKLAQGEHPILAEERT